MMRLLVYGSHGPQVQLLQLALRRAGYEPGAVNGVFDTRTEEALRTFQAAHDLSADGAAGEQTHTALRPWYTGYTVHTLRSGETFYRLAVRYGTTIRAIEIANPSLDPLNLTSGISVTVPLPFAVVPTDIACCSELVEVCCAGIAARYPFVSQQEIGQSVLGRPLQCLSMGGGTNRVLYNAAHHANEWITVPLLLRFAEELAHAAAFGLPLGGTDARALLDGTALFLLPCVNPDGVDLVTGDISAGTVYESALEIAAAFPDISFPAGWKANISGTDLNLQYPAGWTEAREIKFAQGYTRPAPRDYVGNAPLSAPESRAVYDYTLSVSPALTLSYHTQGGVIYWQYLDFDPPGALEIAERFSAASGYLVEATPYVSGFAGYKDWFIQTYDRPGYTIEAGRGENPLPPGDFASIYAENLGILTSGLTATRQSR